MICYYGGWLFVFVGVFVWVVVGLVYLLVYLVSFCGALLLGCFALGDVWWLDVVVDWGLI